MVRQIIKPDEKIDVRMTARDKQLLLEYTLGYAEYVERLEPIQGSTDLLGRYTLDDLEDIIGYIAAEASHTDDAKLKNELVALFDRLYKIQRSFDDGNWNDSAI